MDPLLSIQSLSVRFPLESGEVHAVDEVHLDLYKNETVALIGESGCGKSVIGLSILGLLPNKAQVTGIIHYQGKNLLSLTNRELKEFRGDNIAWIPQNPLTSFDPVMRCGDQIVETIRENTAFNKKKSWDITFELFREMDIIPEKDQVRRYPWQLSGGMLQRALIAMGICCQPQCIIADEPTKGLDTIRRKQILELFRTIKKPGQIMLFITHDLPFAGAIADRVAIMYCGKILEIAPVGSFETGFLHPYSQALLSALPSRGLVPIPANPPSMVSVPSGCRFRPRCSYASDRCMDEPDMKIKGEHHVRCWRYH